MNTKLEIIKVNRFDAGWDATTLFTGFTIRAVLAQTNDMVTKIQERSRLHKRLRREAGEEGVDWILQDSPYSDEVELYLQNSAKLVMWKLQDHESFNKLFDRVEQHVDNLPDEVREE